jgi:hypothetical protein
LPTVYQVGTITLVEMQEKERGGVGILEEGNAGTDDQNN